ncbi:MFS transporter [Salmonella enterica subsp. enterica serovar Choleraesuis]|nr:MFS transporter [Salmonella enterica subsp. enterica serovar Choleraesuis]
MIPTRWQGIIVILVVIIISYIDRVNISVLILNPEFSAHFGLNDNKMLQGLLMTTFLLGYGLAALFLTPIIESRLNCRISLMISILLWAIMCAISPLLGTLGSLLLVRALLGVAEGPLFSIKTRFIHDHFRSDAIGKPNALAALGVSLGLALGFPLVNYLVMQCGWQGAFYALAAINLIVGGGLVWGFIPAPPAMRPLNRLRFTTTWRLAWRTPMLGWVLIIEIATLSYLWGSSAWLPAWLYREHHFSLQATGWLAAVPFLLSLAAKFLGGVILDKLPPQKAPLLFIVGGALTAGAICGLILTHNTGWLALWLLLANACWGLQGAAIPAVVQHYAHDDAVGSAYGVVNGIGNLCAAFIPLAMGSVMGMMGTVSSGFSLLVISQLATVAAGSFLLLRMRRAAALLA